MSFRLVPNSVTLDDLERSIILTALISPNSVTFGADYIKLVEHIPVLSAVERSQFLAIYHLWRYWQGITPSESVKLRHSALVSKNLTNNQP